MPEVRVTDSHKKIVTIKDMAYKKQKRSRPHSRTNYLSPEGTLNAELTNKTEEDLTQFTLKGE